MNKEYIQLKDIKPISRFNKTFNKVCKNLDSPMMFILDALSVCAAVSWTILYATGTLLWLIIKVITGGLVMFFASLIVWADKSADAEFLIRLNDAAHGNTKLKKHKKKRKIQKDDVINILSIYPKTN